MNLLCAIFNAIIVIDKMSVYLNHGKNNRVMRILALDIGDRWIGSALTDELKMIATPHKTIQANELDEFLSDQLVRYDIDTVVVGLPQTMRGKDSTQTIKIRDLFNELEKKFGQVGWALWDERLTSKQADQIKRPKDKEDKLQSHSIAAALILQGYLAHLAFTKNL